MGSRSQTVQQRADPWRDAQPFLRNALARGESLYGEGGFAPTPSFGTNSLLSQQMIGDRALEGAPMIDAAQGTLAGMMNADYRGDRLEAVKREALADAVPAAAAMFSGSGLTNSTMAMDTVGRAATQAVAPIEYGAYQQAEDRAMRAAGMAPALEQAGYLPAQMLGQLGAQQDAMRLEQDSADLRNYEGYLSAMMGLGGLGSAGTTTQPGASGLQRMAAAGLGGLGTYGALASMGLGGPIGIAGGLAGGLLGLL